MALIKCPECEREISDKANVCPNCGCPIIQNETTKTNLICKPKLFDVQPINGMTIDKRNRTFRCGIIGEVLSFDDILDVDIFENGSSLTKTNTVSVVGRAAIGAMINPVGALIGGVTAKKKSVEIINTIEVQITVRSSQRPLVKIDIPIPKKTKKDSKDYVKAINKAKEYVAVIKNLQIS